MSDAAGGPDGPERGSGQGTSQPAAPGPGMRIARLFGVPVYVSPVALVFAVIVAASFAQLDQNRLPGLTDGRAYLLASITAFCFLVSLLLHEIGHALTAKGFGLNVRAVTIYGFAGFTLYEPEAPTPGREFVVAASGPFVNGVLALGCWLGYQTVAAESQPGVLLLDLAATNLVLFVFNLAPGLPLDGGRLVVSGVWRATQDKLRGTQIAAYCGFVVAGAVGLVGVLFVWNGTGGILTIAVAIYLAIGAQLSLRQAQVSARLPSVVAGKIARRTLPVDGSMPLGQALRRAQETGATAVVIVDDDGEPQMIMNGAAVDAMPEARRPWVPVSSVSRPIRPGMTLRHDLAGEALGAALEASPSPEYLVVQDDRPVGVLVWVDVIARLDPAAASRLAAGRR